MAAAGWCQDECKSEIDGIKLELEILRSQVDALQSVINSQDVYSPNNVDNVINDTMKMQIEICDLNIKNKKLETELCLLSNENRHTIEKLVGRIDSLENTLKCIVNKPVKEHSPGASINQRSIISAELRVDSNEQSIPVREQHEIIKETHTGESSSSYIHDNAILITNNNNILFPESVQPHSLPIEAPHQMGERVRVDIKNHTLVNDPNWLNQLPLIENTPNCIVNKPAGERSREARLNQSSIISVEPRADSNVHSIPVCERHEIINEIHEGLSSPSYIHDNVTLILNNNNKPLTETMQPHPPSTKVSDQMGERVRVDIKNHLVVNDPNWLNQLPLIGNINSSERKIPTKRNDKSQKYSAATNTHPINTTHTRVKSSSQADLPTDSKNCYERKNQPASQFQPNYLEYQSQNYILNDCEMYQPDFPQRHHYIKDRNFLRARQKERATHLAFVRQMMAYN